MHVDLITLYLLAIGTLLASSGLTLWEHRTHPQRSKELRLLAAGYATLALGCAAIAFRRELPEVAASGLSNFIIVAGYLLMLRGVACLNNRTYRVSSIVILVLVALTWAIWGARFEGVLWNYVSSVPIAVVSGMTSRELLRNDAMRALKSRWVAVAVSGIHALFYAARAFVLPWLVALHGADVLAVAGKITMYEGVLYSVILPMTLLTLIREETHGRLLQESQTDYLTGLGNRRWFFEESARVIREGSESEPVSLLAFDLDHFKTINDRYGHETGDAVLQSFANITRGVVGPGAMFARIGGEEFVALLPGHDSLRARQVGEAVVERFAGSIAHRIDGTGIHATVSVGLAQSGGETSTLGDLLAAADRALYSAKALGGNRLESAGGTRLSESSSPR
jgi:diguanylate cyclase (GGDEF)-like protein